MNKFNTICLIVAAGSGSRMRHETPKQYMKVAGREIIRRSLDVFLSNQQVDSVQVVYNPDHQELYEEAVQGLDILPPIVGGKQRQDSVRAGLEHIAKYSPKIVLIHDAARPFITSAEIDEVIGQAQQYGAAIAGCKVVDTIQKTKEGLVEKSIERESLYHAQTPQAFDYKAILSAYRASKDLNKFTDDASVYRSSGGVIKIVPTSANNFKITTEDDLIRAQNMLQKPTYTRVGTGYDVHAFCEAKLPENNVIRICGIDIAHECSLRGHSDADVGLHAITDALLGAMGEGDIGEHFPPSDDVYKGADSRVFLQHAAKLVKDKGGSISNIDVTIICEKPKLSNFKEKMRSQIAQVLSVCKSSISVKATTTEKLGFTGRQEGIAAQAVASILVYDL